jgi:RNA polymerase sigma-70 factor (ECF subfamily)
MANIPKSDQLDDDFGGHRQSFETTHWSVVLAASDEEHSTQARAALEALCRTYWFPLFAYLRHRGYRSPDAQDLVQGFFARILARRDLQAVRMERGRFRSYLLTALMNFVANDWNRASAQKRGGGQAPISLDDLMQNRPDEVIATDEKSPDLLFDQQWAVTLLERVLGILREECAGDGRERQFELLQSLIVDTAHTRSQVEVAKELGMTDGAVKQAAFRLRQRYKKLLHAEVANTVATPGDIDEELRYLVTVLRS